MTSLGWQSLGGLLASAPAACSWDAGRLDVFARGADSALWHNGFDNDWSGWERLGGMLASAPTATTRGVGRISIFARGADSAIWHNDYDGGWSGWSSLKGSFTSAPAACSWDAGRLDVFARGTDSALWHNRFDNDWSGWERLGGMLASAPTATTRGSAFDVVACGSDSAAWNYNEAQNELASEEISEVRIHAKILVAPDIPVAESVAVMAKIYEAVGISVELASSESLNIPELNDVDVGKCMEGRTTPEQENLFNHRSGAGTADVVVYFVRSTVPPYNGCAAHPPGIPALVIAQHATQWTLAHEVGHVLGLRHVDNNDRLMTGNGTRNITNPPPELVTDEARTILRSPFSAESP
ncbi:hypothetical protein M4D73_33770 [Streptomyces pseudogriseolus]|uniref:hypothetical protein n=1 Tax=Streptomyces pseudogriseolus TaxID=36817 RepID=UPI003FA319FD|nr:hypothetical protein [Streptomyces pseudogriseolus]